MASVPDFVIDQTGIQIPRFADARAKVVTLWRERFGANAQTASDSPDGLMIDILALLLTQVWEGVEDVYAAGYFRTAEGGPLDYLLDLFGRVRLPATYGTASAVWYGDQGETVAAGSVASTEDTGDRYATDAEGTTATAGSGGPVVFRINAAVDGDTYGIATGVPETTIVAGVSSTPASIAAQLVAELESDEPTYTVSYGGLDPDGRALVVVEDTGGDTLSVGGSTTVPANMDVFHGVRVAMTAEETGERIALAGSLNTIETPASGIEGVATTTDADVGRDRETDPEFRARHLDLLHAGGRATPEAIRARLLNTIDDMEFVRVFENETSLVDADGRPPHSFEVVWIGPAGADVEQAVADEIWESKPAGIQAYGSISSTVEDSQGDDHTVGHSRGTERYLHLDITITPGEGYPTTGSPLTSIRDAVTLYLQPEGDGALQLGSDFYRFVLGAPINLTVRGIANAVITCDDTTNPGDAPTLAAADITVDPDTILRVDSSRVNVHL